MKASNRPKVIEMLRKASIDPRVTEETRKEAARAMRNQLKILSIENP